MRKIAGGSIILIGYIWIALILLHVPNGFRLVPLVSPDSTPLAAIIIFWTTSLLGAWLLGIRGGALD